MIFHGPVACSPNEEGEGLPLTTSMYHNDHYRTSPYRQTGVVCDLGLTQNKVLLLPFWSHARTLFLDVALLERNVAARAQRLRK